MPINLKIFLIVLGFVSIILIFSMVKRKKIMLRHAIFWNFLIVTIMLATIFIEKIAELAALIGVETASNFIFFIGFVIVLVIGLILSATVSIQKTEIIKLVQEVALINSQLKKKEKDYETNK